MIAEALQTLTEKKRNVVLLSYFMDMSDADVAREMNLVRSTINEHRRRSLELMRKNMEESANEKKVKNRNAHLICCHSMLLRQHQLVILRQSRQC